MFFRRKERKKEKPLEKRDKGKKNTLGKGIKKNKREKQSVEEKLIGNIFINNRGFGFVTPEGMVKNEGDIFISKEDINTAMNGDKVEIAIFPHIEPGKAREGRVLNILERTNTKIVGTFSASRKFGFVTPDDGRIKEDIYIPMEYALGARTGEKVVAEIITWPEGQRKAEGKILEVLGPAEAPGVDILSIMRQHDLSESFPEAVQEEADAIEDSIRAEEYLGLEGREDRRHLPIVTIDGEDAKDLDDGIYAEKREDGSFFLGVYIADVSWYVRERSPLDKEAYARGTSVYLADRVVPMLPKALSNGICSLNQGVERLAMACEMDISPEGRVTAYKILPVVIKVYRRLSYTLVNKILVERDKEFIRDNEDIMPLLYRLQELRNAMYKYRYQRGAINFEIPEIRVKLDAQGKAVGLKKRVGSLGESIVEQCMLAANETVAEHMYKKRQPFMYRVHEEPEESKITALNGLLNTFGLHLKTDLNGKVKPKEIQGALEKVAGGPAEKIISTVSLRSMRQARYAGENLGHFGLAAKYYTHFTSPIRRYPDLIVHRLLRETFKTGSICKEKREKLLERLPDMADHTSQRERIAVVAERETTDLKKVEYMQQFVGEEFSATISSVTGFGLFVELDNGIEGLVHIISLADDYYIHDEKNYSLIGRHHHKIYRLGDPIEVLLVRADIGARALDFLLKDNYKQSDLEKALHSNKEEKQSARGEIVPKPKKSFQKKKTGSKDKPAKGDKTKAKKVKDRAKKKTKSKQRKLKRDAIIAEIDPLVI